MAESSSKPRIVVGSDHAGFRAKETIKNYLQSAGYPVEDVGTHSEESVDYPDYAQAVASEWPGGNDSLGILVCGTGIGMSIAANKVEGIRAALAHDPLTARWRANTTTPTCWRWRAWSARTQAIAIVQNFSPRNLPADATSGASIRLRNSTGYASASMTANQARPRRNAQAKPARAEKSWTQTLHDA